MFIPMVISFVIFIIGVVFAVHIRKKGMRWVVGVLVLATFLSLCILYAPPVHFLILMQYPERAGFRVVVLTIVQCMQNAFRTFILDGSWTDYYSESVIFPYSYSALALCLNVFAPILTFAAVLSIFKKATDRIRFFFITVSRKPIVVMSELNRDTLYLAKDIETSLKGKVHFIFTDVFPENTEESYELSMIANRINPLMLKTDIAELEFYKRGKSDIDYYLFGHDETENTSQAIALYDRFYKAPQNRRRRVKIVAKISQPESRMLIDSLDNSYKGEEKESPEAVREYLNTAKILRIRCIDVEAKMALKEITSEEMDIFNQIEGSDGEKIISVLLVAEGAKSMGFLKVLLWYCQMDGYKLEINVVNYGAKGFAEDYLGYKCPEILTTNGCEVEGDAYYSIEFFERNEFVRDMNDFSPENENSHWAERIKRTSVVIVATESEDINLEAGISIREFFSRMRKDNKSPQINVVYEKDENLDISGKRIIAYKKGDDGEYLDYCLRFIGRKSDYYKSKVLFDEELENEGVGAHILWADVDGESEREKAKLVFEYENKAYFREASVSKALHQRAVRRLGIHVCENYPEFNDKRRWKCNCANCRSRRELEHKRWNAFMRTEGYRKNPYEDFDRSERNILQSVGKYHEKLIPYEALGEADKIKDS